jgi:Streptomyces sporulation and cell division protein, SsgA
MGWQTMSSNHSEVYTEIELGLVGPEQMIVPLTATLTYSCSDPYAVRMAFHVGTDQPVEWILARDLLAAALHGREGIGDVQAWPSAASCDPALEDGSVAGDTILNIAMTSPFGAAQFEISAQVIAGFLYRTYKVVATGDESGYLDFDAELAELLSQGLSGPA